MIFLWCGLYTGVYLRNSHPIRSCHFREFTDRFGLSPLLKLLPIAPTALIFFNEKRNPEHS